MYKFYIMTLYMDHFIAIFHCYQNKSHYEIYVHVKRNEGAELFCKYQDVFDHHRESKIIIILVIMVLSNIEKCWKIQ